MAGLSFGQSASSYLEGGSISPSFAEKFSSSPVSDYLNADLSFGTDVTGSDIADKLTGTGALAGGGGGWTFITAPEDVSWDVANAANRVDIFGTNNPPVVAGSRGMRDLTLGNSLVEGFVRNVSIEGKVAALEKLMEYSLNSSDGFVSVPVYQVWANNKSYGGSEAYYIIKNVKVKEKMRDIKGNATRAYVDLSLMQVPKYQVNTGRDQASQVTSGGAALTPEQKAQASANAQANQKVAGATGAAAGSAGAKPKDGPGVGNSKPATTTPPPPIGKLGEELKIQKPPNR